MSTIETYPLEARELTRLSSKEFAKFLAQHETGTLALSLALPMEKRGAETRKNHIIFKNALNEAEDLIAGRGEGFAKMHKTIKELKGLLNEADDLWQHQNKGLLLYLSQNGDCSAFKIPFTPNQRVALSDTPHLTPLLKLLDLPEVLVLKLDLNDTALYRASAYQFEPVLLTDTPMSLEEAMRYDDPEESIQHRSIDSGAGVAYHGQGVTGDETKKKKIQRFYEMLDKGLSPVVTDFHLPLILLGPDDEVGMFRKVCKHPRLREKAVIINPSSFDEEELTEALLEIGDQLADTEREEALSHLQASLAHEKASTQSAEVVKAAMHGRVADLFVTDGAQIFGRFDKATAETTIRDAREPGDYDLVHRAALQSVTQGGRVFFLASNEDLPCDADLAARYRY